LINKIDENSLIIVNKSRKLKIRAKNLIINSVNKIQGKNFLIVEELTCIRCNKSFYPYTTHDGHIRNYSNCPMCRSPYWNIERTRKIYEKKNNNSKETIEKEKKFYEQRGIKYELVDEKGDILANDITKL
jgi:hypothetical protein